MKAKRKIKMRKSIRYFYLAMSILILACSCIYLFKTLIIADNYSTKNEEIYSYENKFNYKYNVNLLPNPYIDEETDIKENTYVTDLIDNINLDLSYNYQADKNTKLQYSYSINGYIEGTFTKDGEEQKIWEKKYELLTKEEQTVNSNMIKIDENIDLNLKQQNMLVKQFEQEMGMNVDAKYLVALEVLVKTEVNGKPIENKYTSMINMDLAEKTTKIQGDNNKSDKKYISNEVSEEVDVNALPMLFSLTLGIASIIVIRYISKKTSPMNRIKNEYRYELNRILRLCQDKIVQVNSEVDIKAEKIIDVKDFGEIIKVSEELFKPILYWDATEKEEAWFSVVSNNVTYRYILKK